MKKTYTAPELYTVSVDTCDIMNVSIGLLFGDGDDEGSKGNTKSINEFTDF